jgi:hypothetical protein
MARYLMDGVFLRDLLVDLPFGSWDQFVEYAHLYYARYPALSLGHHPVLVPVVEAPLFLLFGLSVTTARLITLTALFASTMLLHALLGRRYGPAASLAGGAVLVTSPMIVQSSRTVMSEMPAMALLLASAYFLQRFCESARRSDLIWAASTFVLTLYARPHVVLVAGAFAVSAVLAIPWRTLLKGRVLWPVASAVLLAAPAVAIPILLSPSNASGAMAVARLHSRTSFPQMLEAALAPQLAWPVLLVAAGGAVYGILRRDRSAVLFVLWIVAVVPALYFLGGSSAGPRYTMYWIPAAAALAGIMMARVRPRPVAAGVGALLAAGIYMQVTDTQTIARYITEAGGYEDAARFILSADPGPTVLFSGDVDTGYFTFFVRKHDKARRLVVLRADKLLTTSLMGRVSVEERISGREEIYTILHRFGTRYVVIEDRPSQSRVLEWLREELLSPRFVERARIPIRTSDPRLRGTHLVAFELLDFSVPDPQAVLSLRLPIVRHSLEVPLRDLLERKLLRR